MARIKHEYRTISIFKYHQAAHQRLAWKIRINPKIQRVFKQIWDSEELVVSFDTLCWIPKDCHKKNSNWTHTDQTVCSDLMCYQGLVALTSNTQQSLCVYRGSQELHRDYMRDRKCKKVNWEMIDPDYLESIKDRRIVLDIPAGALVYQNVYHSTNNEERLVQYVCYLPKNHPQNSDKMKEKRLKYFRELRTTTHWPYPIRVVGKQPQTFGNKELEVDYDVLEPPELDDLMTEIRKIV